MGSDPDAFSTRLAGRWPATRPVSHLCLSVFICVYLCLSVVVLGQRCYYVCG